jgi:hypothetical protein
MNRIDGISHIHLGLQLIRGSTDFVADDELNNKPNGCEFVGENKER